jgi:hypothetical protein
MNLRRILTGGLAAPASVASAQPRAGPEDLSDLVTDPTASLMSFQFLDAYAPRVTPCVGIVLQRPTP